MINNFLFRYCLILAILLGCDFLWLSLMGKAFYFKHYAHLMSNNINYFYAAFFYLIYSLCIYFLCINNATSILNAFFLGLLLGLASYSAYNCTNGALFKNWSFIVSLVDVLWGTFVTGFTSLVSYYFINLYK